MASTWQILTILIWCISMHFLGLHIFSKGFLLSRVQIQNKTENEVLLPLGSHTLPQKFKRLLIIIVDALRHDFAAFDNNGSIDTKISPVFSNNMPIFHKLQSENPSKAKLLKFIADPPTTTMQRLKGLTTGSLPTFVDIGANFNGYEITEDSLLYQFNSSNKAMVFMGDDTWTTLFPNLFFRKFPFPSFNVRDLHTVDNGVKKHIFEELSKKDWDVLIAHLLGVDHCGHRFGPNHPEMVVKLTSTNDFLEQVISVLDDDTLLVVGDHGMTPSGDHGGDSAAELEAALFLYAKNIPFVDVRIGTTSVPQLDLVPTLALLTGVNVPFGNLGKPIIDFFLPDAEKITALDIVVKQVSTYLNAYSRISNDIPF